MRGYRKKEDGLILQATQVIVKKENRLGYKRVTVLINRIRVEEGLEKLNKKRIYKTMERKVWFLIGKDL